MDKYERLENFRRIVLRRLTYNEGIPPEIEKIISQAFYGLLNEYDRLRCDTSSIKEYINGNLQYAKNEVNRYLNENRKTSQIEYIQSFMRNLEQELNDSENEITNVNRHQQEIEQINFKDETTTERIEDILNDFLRDVQLRQSRILDARGYSMSRIDDIQQETRIFINRFVSMNEGKIYEALKQNSITLKRWLLEQYQDYIRQEQIEKDKDKDKEKEKGKTQREEFVESLDAGISLEEQSQDAKERNEREEEKQRNAQKEEKQEDISNFVDHMFD